MKLAEQDALALIPAKFDVLNMDVDTFYKAVLVKLLNPGFHAYRERLERYLVGVTARFALQNSPFFARFYGDAATALQTVDDFRVERLPVLTRQDLVTAGDSLFASNELDLPSFSSGTTTGRSLSLIHSGRARENVRELFRRLRARRRGGDAAPAQGFALKLAMLATGNDSESRQYTVFSKIVHGMNKAMDRLQHNATQPSASTRVAFISGHPFDVVDLTMAALRRFGDEFDAVRAPVQQIQTTGTYVSPHLRAWIENAWQAQLIDTLSFSEAPVFASSCPDCGLYHFHPFCHAEAVDATGAPLQQGRGRLLLTAYYPTAITTPIIRYDIGDYVERVPVECQRDPVGYRFLGRVKDSIGILPTQGSEDFLGASEIVDILDDLPDVNRPVPINNVGFSDFVRDQKHWPLYELTNDAGELKLYVQLRFPTRAFPERVNELEQLIRARLSAKAPWLHAAKDPARLQIVFREPERRII